jgi:hypothetical protein
LRSMLERRDELPLIRGRTESKLKVGLLKPANQSGFVD